MIDVLEEDGNILHEDDAEDLEMVHEIHRQRLAELQARELQRMRKLGAL